MLISSALLKRISEIVRVVSARAISQCRPPPARRRDAVEPPARCRVVSSSMHPGSPSIHRPDYRRARNCGRPGAAAGCPNRLPSTVHGRGGRARKGCQPRTTRHPRGRWRRTSWLACSEPRSVGAASAEAAGSAPRAPNAASPPALVASTATKALQPAVLAAADSWRCPRPAGPALRHTRLDRGWATFSMEIVKRSDDLRVSSSCRVADETSVSPKISRILGKPWPPS